MDADAIYGLLTGRGNDQSTGVHIATSEAWRLSLWFGLRETGVCRIGASGAMAERTVVPGVLRESEGGRAG